MAVVQERREVANFDEVIVELPGEIFLQQGDVEELVIEADSEFLPKVKSAVNGGRLEIGLHHWYDFMFLIPGPTVRYHITMHNIHGVQISGTGKLEAGRIQTDRLRLKISGSGEFYITDLQSEALELIFSGSGKARLAGAVTRQDLDISGTGEILAEELDSQEARVRISGSGNTRLRVRDLLDVSITGSGEVRYHGQPRIEHRISGSGRIRPI
jgi:hypothetical protein